MKPVGVIKGQIIGLPGEKVDGITIRATTQNFQGDRSYPNASTITDKDGKYSFAFMEGNVSVWADLDKNSPWFLRHEHSVYAHQNETVTLGMQMVKPVRVSGQVVSKDDRKPVTGVHVFVRSKAQSGFDWVTTDKNGRFESRTLSGPIEAYSRGPWHIFPDQLKDEVVPDVANPDDENPFELPQLEAAEVKKLLAAMKKTGLAKIQGVISDVNIGGKTVKLSVGADDGLVIGQVLEVYETLPGSNNSSSMAKAKIRVTNDIDPDSSIAQIIQLQPNAVLQRGNYVVRENAADSEVNPAE